MRMEPTMRIATPNSRMTRKIPLRYRVYVFALLMSFCTGLIVSAIIIGLHSTSPAGFLQAWPMAFLTAWPIVFIAILAIAPQINRLTDRIVE